MFINIKKLICLIIKNDHDDIILIINDIDINNDNQDNNAIGDVIDNSNILIIMRMLILIMKIFIIIMEMTIILIMH